VISDPELTFEIRETSNRGSLMFRGDMMRSLGFFDERNFLNGNDDHDIHARAIYRGWYTGYYRVRSFSTLRNREKEHLAHIEAYKSNNMIGHMNLSHFAANRDGGFIRLVLAGAFCSGVPR
jgi:GT2 family glycosyltransferase